MPENEKNKTNKKSYGIMRMVVNSIKKIMKY